MSGVWVPAGVCSLIIALRQKRAQSCDSAPSDDRYHDGKNHKCCDYTGGRTQLVDPPPQPAIRIAHRRFSDPRKSHHRNNIGGDVIVPAHQASVRRMVLVSFFKPQHSSFDHAFGPTVCFYSKVIAMPNTTSTTVPVVRLYICGAAGFLFLEDPTIFQLNPHSGRCEQLIDSHSTVDKQFTLALKFVSQGARLQMTVYDDDLSLHFAR
jgi:hypothetical protein